MGHTPPIKPAVVTTKAQKCTLIRQLKFVTHFSIEVFHGATARAAGVKRPTALLLSLPSTRFGTTVTWYRYRMRATDYS